MPVTPERRLWHPRESGFSLVELMISMVIVLLVTAAAITIESNVFRSNAQAIFMTQLSQEMRSAIQLISRDIRRAGYNDDAISLYLSTQPLASGISLGSLDEQNATNCLRVQYEDLQGNPVNVVYRRRVVSDIGRIAAHFGATASCATALSDTGWIDVSDPVITDVTELQFVRSMSMTDIAENLNTGLVIQVGMELVSIRISATLRADPTINRTIRNQVQIRNQFLTV